MYRTQLNSRNVSVKALFSNPVLPSNMVNLNSTHVPSLGSPSSETSKQDINIEFVEYVEPELGPEITEPYLEKYRKHAHDFVDPDIKHEPLLSLKSKRHTVLPIQYPELMKNYNDQMEINWSVGDVDLAKDIYDWENNLTNEDRYFISHVLAFFASADSIVNSNLQSNVLSSVMVKESQLALGKQFEMEGTHAIMYSVLLDTFVKDEKILNNLINSIRTMPTIKKKADWCEKWASDNKTFAHGLFAFAIVEGVCFSGSFASIFWLKTRPGNIMPGLIKSNRFISKDEAKHFELNMLHNKMLVNRLKQSVVYEIMKEAVDIEIEFIVASLPCRLLGMNSDLMSQYIKYVADRCLVQFGYDKLYNAENPFEFMTKIDTYVKSNFFEERNDNYVDPKVSKSRQERKGIETDSLDVCTMKEGCTSCT